jgi:hypothetical protein
MSNYYFFNSIYKYTIAFCKLFTDFHIRRYDNENNLVKNFRVNIMYAEKSKAYMKLFSSKIESVGVKLPLISIYMKDMQYMENYQMNNLWSNEYISKIDNGLRKYIENPAPYIFKFEVNLWTKYPQDMHKLLEQILPKFRPKITQNINILPEINLSLEIPVKLVNVINNSENELDNTAGSSQMQKYTLEFEMLGYLFPPIKEQKITKQIEIFNKELGIKQTVYSDESPYDIVNNKLINTVDISETVVKEFQVNITKDINPCLYLLDITSELGTYGENLYISDSDGNDYDFVYEYDNGEFYSADTYIPSTLSLSKTGRIAIDLQSRINGEKVNLYIKTSNHENYVFPHDIIELYEDFNNRNMRNVIIEDKTFNDIIYINGGKLFVKTIDGSCVVFSRNSISEIDKLLEIGLSDLPMEADKYIGGFYSSDSDNLYLKINSGNNGIEVHEVISEVDTILTTISFTNDIEKIILEYNSGTGEHDLTINSITYSFTANANFITPFINWNGTAAAEIEYFKGYKKL